MIKNRIVLLGIMCFVFSSYLSGQVGVNTLTPREDLEVNGSLQVREDLSVWDNSTGALNPGEKGQYLLSKGENNPPEWVTLPDVYWKLQQAIIIAGDKPNTSYELTAYKCCYIVDDGTVEGSRVYEYTPSTNSFESPLSLEENSPLVSPWFELEGYKSEIYLTKENSKIGYNFQTIVQLVQEAGDKANNIVLKVAVGAFLDNKLKTVRTLSVLQSNDGFEILSLNDILSDLSPKSDGSPYVLQIAVRLRLFAQEQKNTSPRRTFLIGRAKPISTGNSAWTTPIEPENTSDFMNRSNLLVNVFEPIDKIE